ncbi:MAG: bifunctional hydroxymethylpyrimidine kinase/phosphomethylpyrimidine kinase [Acidobacteriota bacterium]
MNSKRPPICLSIAGLDPSGGAGIIADVRTFSAFGCFPTAVSSSLTFQNTTGVFGAAHQTAETIRGQLEPVLRDYYISALKTGMLPTTDAIEETAIAINEFELSNLVVDPVVRSTSGADLIDDAALRILVEKLFPLSILVTPNLSEAARIARMTISTDADIEAAARLIQAMGAANVLIKGGHLFDDSQTTADRKARDFLFVGPSLTILEADFIETTATHGTGCTLSAAIAANLALGKGLIEAVEISKGFVTEAIRTAPNIGHGASPINIENY